MSTEQENKDLTSNDAKPVLANAKAVIKTMEKNYILALSKKI